MRPDIEALRALVISASRPGSAAASDDLVGLADFSNWLAGFIDGEGCFLINSAKGHYAAAFSLHLRDDDRPVLVEIVRRTGIGYVKKIKRGVGPHQTGWAVTSRKDCSQLVALLDRYPLRAKKARDYAIWHCAVDEWLRVPGHARRRDWSAMGKLKAELEEVRRYRPVA